MKKKLLFMSLLTVIGMIVGNVSAQTVLADYEDGSTGAVTIVARSASNGLSVEGVVNNPSMVINTTEKAFKVSTGASWNTNNTWESGLDLKFSSAIPNGSYIHFAFYTTLGKIEFPGRKNLLAGGGTTVTGGDSNELKPIAQNKWFDVVVPMPAGFAANEIFTIWIDSRSFESNQNKELYIDEIVVSTSSSPRTEFAPTCPNPTLDTDGDGVADCYDLCPDTSAGTPVDAKGCPIDAPDGDDDGDGVPNKDDLCPDTLTGTPVDASGCPLDPPCEFPEATIANFEIGGSNKVSFKTYDNKPGITYVGLVENPTYPLDWNYTSKAYKITTSPTYSSNNTYQSGIQLTFSQAISSGAYIHFAIYTNMDKMEFWDASNVKVGGSGTTVIGGGQNSLKPIAEGQWFDVVMPTRSIAMDGESHFAIMFDSRPCGGNPNDCGPNNDKYIYFDEITIDNDYTPRTLVGCPLTPDGINSFVTGNLSAYVNADKQIVVNTANSADAGKVSVYNISGKRIEEQAVNGAETVISTRLDAGIYLVQLYQGNSVKTAKLLVY